MPILWECLSLLLHIIDSNFYLNYIHDTKGYVAIAVAYRAGFLFKLGNWQQISHVTYSAIDWDPFQPCKKRYQTIYRNDQYAMGLFSSPDEQV